LRRAYKDLIWAKKNSKISHACVPLKLKSDSALIKCLSHVSVDSAYAEPTTKNRKNVPYYQRKNIMKNGMQNIIHFNLAAAAV
jgi:hypothetical protein